LPSSTNLNPFSCLIKIGMNRKISGISNKKKFQKRKGFL
jgi:hypothetical protein